MPDLDLTAKSNFTNNVLNIVGWFITNFTPLKVVFYVVTYHRIFGAETPKIEIAVQNMKKKKTRSWNFQDLYISSTPELPHKTRKKLKGVMYGAS